MAEGGIKVEIRSLAFAGAAGMFLFLAGTLIGRKWSGARRAAAYAVPLLLVLCLSLLVIYGAEVFLLWGLAPWVLLALGFLEAGMAVISAWLPNRISFGLGGMAGVMGFLLAAVSADGIHLKGSLLGAVCYGLLLAAGTMGAVSRKKEEPQETAPRALMEEEKGQEERNFQERKPQGCLTFFSGMFAGQRIPVLGSEEIRIGSDAASCHLILDMPGIPACLCRIRWLENRNTYLITSGPQSCLSFGDGTSLPPGGSMEVWSGTILYWRETEAPAFRLGQKREQKDE